MADSNAMNEKCDLQKEATEEFKNNEQKTIEAEYNSADNEPVQNASAQNATPSEKDTKKKSKTHTIKKKTSKIWHLIFDAIVAGASILTVMKASLLTASAPVLAGVGVISFIAARGNRRLINYLQSSEIQVKNAQIDKKNKKIAAYNEKHPNRKQKKIINHVSRGLINESIVVVGLQILSMLVLSALSGGIAPQIIIGLISFIVTKVIPNKTIFKNI